MGISSTCPTTRSTSPGKAACGRVSDVNTLTPEPNRPLFFNLLWWGMAAIGRAFGLGPAGCLQVLRVVATVLFLIVVHRLCALFLADRLQRRTAFLVATLSSGFGWILVALKYTIARGELYFPLDVFIAEGNTFYCILAQPHFIAAALYAFVFELVLRGEESGRLRWAAAAGLITLLLGWQHAYDLASVYGVLAAYVLLRALRDRAWPRRLITACVVIGALSWWPGAYSTVLVRLEPTWRAVLAQFGNAGVATPTPLHLVILLGPAFLLAVLAVAVDRPWRLAGIDDRRLLLRAWFLSGFVLIYLPVSWNVHLINGWQIPCHLATRRCCATSRRRCTRGSAASIAALCSGCSRRCLSSSWCRPTSICTPGVSSTSAVTHTRTTCSTTSWRRCAGSRRTRRRPTSCSAR
jgi:hypothetical protein